MSTRAPVDADERVRRMQAGAQRRRVAVAAARGAYERARVPYDEAASELLALMEAGAPKEQEHAARRRMWAAHPAVAAARRALSDAEAKRR